MVDCEELVTNLRTLILLYFFSRASKMTSSFSDDVHVYCLSNGSEDLFPNNTLTDFLSKLPFNISHGKNDKFKWHVAVESIGFHANFMTKAVALKSNTPHIIMLDVKDKLLKESICVGMETMPLDCNAQVLDQLFKEKYNLNAGVVNLYYFQEDKVNYNVRRYFLFLKNLQTFSPLVVNYSNDDNCFTLKPKDDYIEDITFLLHSSMLSFLAVSEYQTSSTKIQIKLYQIKNELYYGYVINGLQYIKLQIVNDALKPVIPNIVKLQSSIIREQIYNDQHSKDLICFSPVVNELSNFVFFEVEFKTFFQLSNTIINIIDFKLLDESNKYLKLNEGVPTVIKLHFTKMLAHHKSFQVRLSPKRGELPSSFKIKLPQTLYFTREWNVAISSILMPGRFSTFPNLNELRYVYRNENDKVIDAKLYIPRIEYAKQELIDVLNKFLSNREHSKRLGKVEEKLAANEFEPTLEFTFYQEGIFVVPQEVCEVIGYGAADFVDKKKRFIIKFAEGKTNFKLKMSYSIKMKFFKPMYIMAYSNIVEPTPVNAELTNLLKVFQVSDSTTYKLYEFKHLEYHKLLNNEISDISIDLRTHTGELINYEITSNTSVIVNLLFSNYK